MSILDQLTEDKTYAAAVLVEEIEAREDYACTVHIDTVTPDLPDVTAAVEKVIAVFTASHYIPGFCIDGVTVPEHSRITRDLVPKGIAFREDKDYGETYCWSRFRITVSFNFRTRFRENWLTVDDERVCTEYGILRFLMQLVNVCGHQLDFDWTRSAETTQDLSRDHCITVCCDGYDTQFRKPQIIELFGDINGNRNKTQMEDHLKTMTRAMDREMYWQHVVSEDYETAVFRYLNRSRAYSLKRNGWKTTVWLTPAPTYSKLAAEKKDDIGRPDRTSYGPSGFEYQYALDIRGRGITDMYVRYRLLQAVCEFSTFGDIFTVDKDPYSYAELFWRMAPKKFRARLESDFDRYNFYNKKFANFLVKQMLEIYDAKGCGAVLAFLKEELNSEILAEKVNIYNI